MATANTNKYLAKLKTVVLSFLRDEDVGVVLFGSRARSDNTIGSDVDIGILPHGQLNQHKLTLLREKVEQLNIPYKVEIVNFNETTPSFKKAALKEAVVWKD